MDDEGVGSQEDLRAALLAEYDDALAAGGCANDRYNPIELDHSSGVIPQDRLRIVDTTQTGMVPNRRPRNFQ